MSRDGGGAFVVSFCLEKGRGNDADGWWQLRDG